MLDHSGQLQDGGLAAAEQRHSAPHEQSLPHWQLTAVDSQLQEGPQLQAVLLHSFFIEISWVCGLDKPYLPGGTLRHLNEGATLSEARPLESRTCAGKFG
jgi:hypothetical protein